MRQIFWSGSVAAAAGEVQDVSEAGVLGHEQGYFIWGAHPFLRLASQRELDLEILVSADPLFQRIMAAVIVSPEKVRGVNVEGATALRDYLLSPQAQAKIAAFRSPWSDKQLWWSGGRDN